MISITDSYDLHRGTDAAERMSGSRLHLAPAVYASCLPDGYEPCDDRLKLGVINVIQKDGGS